MDNVILYGHLSADRFSRVARVCTPPQGIAHGLGCIACFGIAFCSMCLLTNLCVTRNFWRPTLPQSTKLRELAEVSADVSVIFVGSSHCAHSIVPDVFDSVAHAHGIKTKSFNLGIDGLFVYEQIAVLREVAKLDLPNLRYVFVEPRLVATPTVSQILSDRMRYACDWDATLLSCRLKYHSKRPSPLRVTLGAYGLKMAAFAVHMLNIGVLSDCLLPQVEPMPTRKDPLARGYEAYRKPFADGQPPTLRFAATTENNVAPSDFEVSVILTELSMVSKMGAVPVLLIAPFDPGGAGMSYFGQSLPQAISKLRPDMSILNYSYDGTRGGVYLDPALWFDSDHLNDAGAHIFSAELATDFTKFCRSRGS